MLKRIATASIVLTLVVSGAAFAAAQAGTKVTLHSTNKGKVLAMSTGRTLYLYTPDGKNKSNCTNADGCAQTWPPLMTTGKPVAGPGVKQSLLSTTKRPNGKLQVTYNGHPLYRYTGDMGPGQATGEGTDGIWFVVRASGNKAATRR